MKSRITITAKWLLWARRWVGLFSLGGCSWYAWPYKYRGMNQMPRMWAKADKNQCESCSVHRLVSRCVMPWAVWKELLQPGIPKLLWTGLWTHPHRVWTLCALPSASFCKEAVSFLSYQQAAQVKQGGFFLSGVKKLPGMISRSCECLISASSGLGTLEGNTVLKKTSVQCGWKRVMQWLHFIFVL